MLRGKKILLGVCGSIAAYKAALIVRLLVKSGAEVRVIMTASALDFITPLTLATLSKNPVLHQFQADDNGSWNNHVELGLWADAMLVAPASANTLGKMANGLCDNLLMATYLSARCPVFVAPAMDLDMYAHQSTQENLNKIKAYGNTVLTPASGELASGLHGEGRMQEPEELVAALDTYFDNGPLKNKIVLITAGPTYEAIDPVRFVGNHSTGKMGYALAEQAANLGAKVILVSGPVSLSPEHEAIKLVKVQSAREMHEACMKYYDGTTISIMAAAVADYRPEEVADKKIKKNSDTLSISLVKNPDIAADLGSRKKAGQMNVGFALETDNEAANAQKKIASKNLDFIVLNSLNDAGAGFGHDTNKITIIDRHNNSESFELKSKKDVARDILNVIINAL